MKQDILEETQVFEKLESLRVYLQKLGSILVAYSAGVDSAVLLKVAHEVLGDQVMAVTAASCFVPERETAEAASFCKQEGIRHWICPVEVLQISGLAKNPPDRCYHCKKALFRKFGQIALENDIMYIVEGSNLDDTGDYRPGLRAIEELGVKSPLRDVGLTKVEIRFLARDIGLSVWDKPSYACLASRFVYGEEITEEKLKRVDRAEQFLLDRGFHQMRVRIHGQMARIEVETDEFPKLLQEENRKAITAAFQEYGFTYVTVDLTGYRTGSMNETLL